MRRTRERSDWREMCAEAAPVRRVRYLWSATCDRETAVASWDRAAYLQRPRTQQGRPGGRRWSPCRVEFGSVGLCSVLINSRRVEWVQVFRFMCVRPLCRGPARGSAPLGQFREDLRYMCAIRRSRELAHARLKIMVLSCLDLVSISR